MKHRVAIIGLGGAGLGHLRYWRSAGVEIGAVCDTQPSLVELRQKQFQLTSSLATTDFDEVLQKSNCDLISICTPDHEHVGQAIAALESGRHVHIEKPVCNERSDLIRLVAAARQHPGRLVGLHYQLRFFWLNQTIKTIIDRGDLGTVFAMEADYLHNIAIRDIGTSNWREVNATTQPAFGGLGGTHFVDLLRWFMGDEVVSVTALGNRAGWPAYPSESHVTALLRFRRGGVGKITVSIGATFPKQHPMRIFGTKACVEDNLLFTSPRLARPTWLGTKLGTLSRGRVNRPLSNGVSWLLRRLPIRLEHFPFSTYEHGESCAKTVANFVRAVDGHEPLEGTLDEAALTFCVCEAVERSLREGGEVAVNYTPFRTD